MQSALMQGPLSKWTNVMQGWQYRWFVLDEYNGVLSYYTSKEKMIKGVRRGCVRLKHAIIGIDNEDDSTFTVKVDHKTFHFQARDADEREQWTRALEMVIRMRNNGPDKNFHPRYQPNLPEFEKRLAESDAYLQILLEQTRVRNLKTKRDQLKGVSRTKLDAIVSTADQMSEYVKHALIILQIAKNECQNPAVPLEEARVLDLGPNDPRGPALLVDQDNEVGRGIERAREVLPDVSASRSRTKLHSQTDQRSSESDETRLPRLLPWTSYSSDDEFYDAEDTFEHSPSRDSGL